MAESKPASEARQSTEGEPLTAVILPFPESRLARGTPEELAEYREMLPLLRQMVKEWQVVKQMCPMARRLTEE